MLPHEPHDGVVPRVPGPAVPSPGLLCSRLGWFSVVVSVIVASVVLWVVEYSVALWVVEYSVVPWVVDSSVDCSAAEGVQPLSSAKPLY